MTRKTKTVKQKILKNKHFLFKNSIFHHTASSATVSYVDSGDGSYTNAIMRNCSLLTTHDGSLGGTSIIRFGVIENTILRNLGDGDQTVGIDAADSRSNNCTFGNFLTEQTGGTDGGGNLTNTNPLFVSESSNPPDFKLQSGSPCIGAGKTIAAITEDFDGNSRSAPYDMGAYAFVDTGPSFTPNVGSETYQRKFGSNSFVIHGTANKLATRRFNSDKDNRQAPFSVTVAGPATIRRRTTPYKNET